MAHDPPPDNPPATPAGGDGPPPNKREGAAARRDLVLRRTVVRPARPAPDPVDAAFVANRLTTLTHDLSNLLDGALRVVSLARRSISRAEAAPALAAGNRAAEPTQFDELDKRLDTLQAAMGQMAELVRASMCGLGAPAGAPRLGRDASSSLAEAVMHAAEVMRPVAEDKCIRLDVDVAPELADLSAGPVYTVVASAVRNAIEAIERRVSPVGGFVFVRAWVESGRAGQTVYLEVTDDGVGPPATPVREHGPEGVFRLGFSTKPGGSGIGLTISRDVVGQLGGSITLTARDRAARAGSPSVGAVLRVSFPAPSPLDDLGPSPFAKTG